MCGRVAAKGIEGVFGTPEQEAAQIGVGVDAGAALEPGQVGRGRQPDRVDTRGRQNLIACGSCHASTIDVGHHPVQILDLTELPDMPN